MVTAKGASGPNGASSGGSGSGGGSSTGIHPWFDPYVLMLGGILITLLLLCCVCCCCGVKLYRNRKARQIKEGERLDQSPLLPEHHMAD